MTENYLTVEQASKKLQIAPYTLREWLKQGKLQGVKVGRAWRVAESTLSKFLKIERRADSRAALRKRVQLQLTITPEESTARLRQVIATIEESEKELPFERKNWGTAAGLIHANREERSRELSHGR